MRVSVGAEQSNLGIFYNTHIISPGRIHFKIDWSVNKQIRATNDCHVLIVVLIRIDEDGSVKLYLPMSNENWNILIKQVVSLDNLYIQWHNSIING